MPCAKHYFTLRWPEGHVFSNEPLKLCFEAEAEAEAWRDALTTATIQVGLLGRWSPSSRRL